MTKPFFSIIFPTYNVAPYIANAMQDLMGQTFGDFEAIVVDDCATDGSGRIAESFAAQDERIRVIHKEQNGGVSAARNDGMDRAVGEYILFWDPDDRMERTLLQVVKESLDLANGDRSIAKAANPNVPDVDILYYSLIEDYYDASGRLTSSYEKNADTAELWEPGDIRGMVNELEGRTMLGYPWNKAYRLAYLKEHAVRFPQIKHVEDILFNIAAVEKAEHIVVLRDVLYHYRNMGQARLTSSYLPDYLKLQKTRIQAFLDLYGAWNVTEETDPDLHEAVLQNMSGTYFRSLFSAVEREIAHRSPREDIRSMLEAEYQSELFAKLAGHLKGGKSVRLLYAPLVQRQTGSVLRRARAVSFVRKNMPGIFAGLKQNR